VGNRLAWVAITAIAAAWFLRRRVDVVEVRGSSMAPVLVPGDRLLVVRSGPRPGRIVLANDPREPRRELIKRVGRVDRAGVWLVGDDPSSSTDARAFGHVPAASVRWRAVARYWPLRRAGRLGSARVWASDSF
jgi:nickel-type superoxide dismutase maturation protease